MVEADSSYHAMPSATNSALWVERTPPGFIFDMKMSVAGDHSGTWKTKTVSVISRFESPSL